MSLVTELRIVCEGQDGIGLTREEAIADDSARVVDG